ncbi:MAG: hypothetical protein WCF04_01210 [Candidatus Nanopelagicales bacterium]
MSLSRRSLPLVAIALAPLVLSGCEKPNPGATVWSGTQSEHVEALCWQRDEGKALGPLDCAQDVLAQASSGEGIARLEVSPGDTVGVSVDTKVADSGWALTIAGQTLVSGLHETYYRFTFPEQVVTDGTGYTMQVIASAEPTGTRGYWFFQLVPS